MAPPANARRALLLGATGLVGARCLAHLLKREEYTRIVCLVRRAGSLSLPKQEKDERLEERVVDFDKLTTLEPPNELDVFCAIGSTIKKAGSQEAFRRVDYDLPLNIAKLAIKAGTKRFALVSSIGADPSSSNFYLKTKGELEEALADLFETNKCKALHVMQPSFLVGDRKESRPGERIGIGLAKMTSGLLMGGLRRYRPINVDTVGHAMVAAMLGPDPDSIRKTYTHDAIEALAK